MIRAHRVLLISLLCAALLCAGGVWTAFAGRRSDPVTRVACATGKALVSAAGGPPFSLVRGALLRPGDRIDTRGGGRVVVSFADGTVAIVPPESVVVLKSGEAGASVSGLFQIILGRVRIHIRGYAVRQTVSVAVRG